MKSRKALESFIARALEDITSPDTDERWEKALRLVQEFEADIRRDYKGYSTKFRDKLQECTGQEINFVTDGKQISSQLNGGTVFVGVIALVGEDFVEIDNGIVIKIDHIQSFKPKEIEDED